MADPVNNAAVGTGEKDTYVPGPRTAKHHGDSFVHGIEKAGSTLKHGAEKVGEKIEEAFGHKPESEKVAAISGVAPVETHAKEEPASHGTVSGAPPANPHAGNLVPGSGPAPAPATPAPASAPGTPGEPAATPSPAAGEPISIGGR